MSQLASLLYAEQPAPIPAHALRLVTFETEEDLPPTTAAPVNIDGLDVHTQAALSHVLAGHQTASQIGKLMGLSPKTVIGRLYALARAGLIERYRSAAGTLFFPVGTQIDRQDFALGDRVRWLCKTRSNGPAERTGIVIQIVPPGGFPQDGTVQQAGRTATRLRKVTSYVIDVGGDRRRTRYYWPFSESLERAG